MSQVPAVTARIGETPYTVTVTDADGHQWLSDEAPADGGSGRGPTPHQLLLSSLAACTAMTLRMYAVRKGWPPPAVEVEMQFNPDGPPPGGGSDLRRRISLRGDFNAGQRARLLQIANACPLHKVLTGEIRIATSLT